MIQNEEFIQDFIDEAKSHIDGIEAAWVGKENAYDDMNTINDVFRAIHSIKGTAGFFGLKNIVSLSHSMENVLGEARSRRIILIDQDLDELLKALDLLKQMIFSVHQSESYDIQPTVYKLEQILTPDERKCDTKPTANPVVFLHPEGRTIRLEDSSGGLAAELLEKGYQAMELELGVNRHLRNGPVHLFKQIQQYGAVVDSVLDHDDINSIDDILEAIETQNKDLRIRLIMMVSIGKLEMSEILAVTPDCIHELVQIGTTELEQPVDPDPSLTVNVIQVNKESMARTVHQVNPDQENRPIKIEETIRVQLSILNDLMNIASEMVLGRNQLLRTLDNHRKSIPGLAPILQNIDRLTSGMQEKIMQTRMQPLGNVFNKFPRIIRDVSKLLNKEVELIIKGESVELDKSIIEGLTDPLTHLVRNAVDHGLEKPDIRIQSGKTRKGTIKLSAYHEGGYVNIDVMDDGRGIDAERVKMIALERDIVTPAELSKMSEYEVLRLIFMPGFSTAEVVTDISGRGVGMDVVKTNIEKLGGSIEIMTSKGLGSTIRLMLPLTLAIIQSLIVEAEGQKFALPQVNLKEIVNIKSSTGSHQIERINQSEVLRLRERLLPVVYLSDVLGMGRSTAHSAKRVLVIKMGSRMFGIAVDSIIGSEETLVKPLPTALKECTCYSGVTIMGDGKASMILDVEGIIRLADLKFREEVEQQQEERGLAERIRHETQNLLLFKCSGPEMFVIDLAMVARVEVIRKSDIQSVGDREYISFRNESLRIIRPEQIMNTASREYESDKLYVIIPKLISHPIGILIGTVYDNISAELTIDSEKMHLPGIVGSTLYDNKIILLVNIYDWFERAAPEYYAPKTKGNGQGRSILLVEDTPFFRKLGVQYLQAAGYNVKTAENGLEALQLLETTYFDAVVSDIQMPVMDGLQLIKRIRGSAEWNHLPCVALSSLTNNSHKKLGIECGFDYYEEKLDRERLLHTLDQVLSSKRSVV